MLKMTIDNEEVVSKNNFSIKEEMLSASSTILNNTYPATWEQDHDYTSRFYYPKDYSRMTLNRETHILPEEGSNVEINGSTQISVDNTKEASITYLKGNTSQYTTTGKNLLELTDGSYSARGITATVSNGVITLNGTATANAFVIITSSFGFTAGNTITVSTNNPVASANIKLRIDNAGYLDTALNTTNKTNTIDTTGYTLNTRLTIRVENGTTLTNFILKPQIELGSTATDYEPYTGGIASPNPSYPEPIQNITGNQDIEVSNGTITNTYSINLGNIELNKIGNYQDRIFKNTLTSPYYDSNLELDKWYLYKAIGKVVLDGSETSWHRTGTSTSGNYYFFTDNVLSNVLYDSNNSFIGISNVGITTDAYQRVQGIDTIFYNSNNRTRFYSDTTKSMSVSDFKTWLSTHNTIVYYVLATPTTTEITNSTLINELESIELLNGLNNITITSENLSAITGLHYNYITEQWLNDLIFSGIVKNTNNISLNPRQPKYCSLQILDNKTLLSEGNTLDFVISNKTILEAIEMVVDAISDYGFQLGNVNILNGNEIIGTYSTENKTAYDVLQYLADISGAKWNCRRIDDTNMYIDFYDPSLMPRGKDIKYTTQWAQENNLVDLQFNYGTRDYRNKQVILSDEVIGDIDYTERVASDGMTKEFVVANNIAKIVKVEIDGEEQTVATNEEKEVGIYADFYYSINSNTITANKILPYGSLIDITYTPVIKGREVVQNDNEIDRLNTQLGVNGTISRYEDRNDETNSNKLLAIASTYLKYKGEAEITLTVKTHNTDLYQVGQTVYFDAPIDQLKKDYMVKSKEINIYVNNGLGDNLDFYDVFYTYTLSSSFNSERAVNWFDNQRAKTEGNIKEDEYINRNIDINNNATIIWDNLQIEEISLVQSNNDLNAPTDAPIIH